MYEADLSVLVISFISNHVINIKTKVLVPQVYMILTGCLLSCLDPLVLLLTQTVMFFGFQIYLLCVPDESYPRTVRTKFDIYVRQYVFLLFSSIIYSAGSLKQKYQGRHISPLRHIVLIPRQAVLALTLN
jgi:hypothetical protein